MVQPLYFNIWDESKSVYFQANVKAFNADVDQVQAPCWVGVLTARDAHHVIYPPPWR